FIVAYRYMPILLHWMLYFATLNNFFFSSRRRHTRFSRDWSSDVCSSDLGSATANPPLSAAPGGAGTRDADLCNALGEWRSRPVQIGRASCRERETVLVVGGAKHMQVADMKLRSTGAARKAKEEGG